MWPLRSSLAVAAAALLGCAASPPPPPQGMPARAAAPGIVRWEQFCEQATSVGQASWLAGSRGADGWELVSMYNGVLCYKRPEPPRAPPIAPVAPPEVLVQRPPAGPSAPVSGAPQSTVPRILDPGF